MPNPLPYPGLIFALAFLFFIFDEFWGLAFILGGYILFDRNFAYAHIQYEAIPIYVTEFCLLSWILIRLVRDPRSIFRLRDLPATIRWSWPVFFLIGVFSFSRGITHYSPLVAVRDFAMCYYSLVFLLTASMLWSEVRLRHLWRTLSALIVFRAVLALNHEFGFGLPAPVTQPAALSLITAMGLLCLLVLNKFKLSWTILTMEVLLLGNILIQLVRSAWTGLGAGILVAILLLTRHQGQFASFKRVTLSLLFLFIGAAGLLKVLPSASKAFRYEKKISILPSPPEIPPLSETLATPEAPPLPKTPPPVSNSPATIVMRTKTLVTVKIVHEPPSPPEIPPLSETPATPVAPPPPKTPPPVSNSPAPIVMRTEKVVTVKIVHGPPSIAVQTAPLALPSVAPTSVETDQEVLSEFLSFFQGIKSANVRTRLWFWRDAIFEVFSFGLFSPRFELKDWEKYNLPRQRVQINPNLYSIVVCSPANPDDRVEIRVASPGYHGDRRKEWMVRIPRALFGLPFGKPFYPPEAVWQIISPKRYDPHNSFVAVLYRMGVVGIVSLICLIVGVLRFSSRAMKQSSPPQVIRHVAVWSMLACFIIHSMTDNTLENPFKGLWFWVLLGLLCALSRPSTRENTHHP